MEFALRDRGISALLFIPASLQHEACSPRRGIDRFGGRDGTSRHHLFAKHIGYYRRCVIQHFLGVMDCAGTAPFPSYGNAPLAPILSEAHWLTYLCVE